MYQDQFSAIRMHHMLRDKPTSLAATIFSLCIDAEDEEIDGLPADLLALEIFAIEKYCVECGSLISRTKMDAGQYVAVVQGAWARRDRTGDDSVEVKGGVVCTYNSACYQCRTEQWDDEF